MWEDKNPADRFCDERHEGYGEPKRDLIDDAYDNWGGGIMVFVVVASTVVFGLSCYGCFALLAGR